VTSRRRDRIGKGSLVRSPGTSYPDAPREGETGSARELSIATADGVARFAVHARPKAQRSAIAGVRSGVLDVRIAAPPADGLANEELVRFLAETLRIGRHAVRLVRGASSREKLLEVAGLSADEIELRLNSRVRAASEK